MRELTQKLVSGGFSFLCTAAASEQIGSAVASHREPHKQDPKSGELINLAFSFKVSSSSAQLAKETNKSDGCMKRRRRSCKNITRRRSNSQQVRQGSFHINRT